MKEEEEPDKGLESLFRHMGYPHILKRQFVLV